MKQLIRISASITDFPKELIIRPSTNEDFSNDKIKQRLKL